MKTIPRHSLLPVLSLSLMLANGFSSVRAESEVLEITDLQGRKMNARLVSSDGQMVNIARDGDQKKFALPMTQLDGTTQRLVFDWIEKGGSLLETYEVNVDTGKTRKKDGSEDFDDKRVNLKPVVTVKNPDAKYESRNADMTVIFIGRPVQSNSDIFILKSQLFEIPKLKPLTSVEFKMDEISQAYDNRGYAQFGARYVGYAILIHDAAGEKIYFSRSVPAGPILDHGKKLLDLKTGMTYDRDLTPKQRLR